MKRPYVKPKAVKLDYAYEEQVTASSAGGTGFVGRIGSLYEFLDLCQMGLKEDGTSTCTHYFYSSPDPCKTTEMPMSLRPWS